MTGGVALSISGLRVDVGTFALRDVSLDVPPGVCTVLMGPTGSGKSLLIESICGLRAPQAGSVYVAGRDVTRLDPAKRCMGYVPQDYALLPFKTVRENLEFALAARRIPRSQWPALADDMLSLLRIEHIADRYPARLSGGERQRVALGRALLIRPDVLLLDEPLCALDETTADEVMEELLRIRRRFDVTTLHICHSMDEALRMGDRLAIMRLGRIVQTGTPQEIFQRPNSLFVARLLRLPTLTVGQIREDGSGRRRFYIGATAVADTSLPPGNAQAVIAPEHMAVSAEQPLSGDGIAVFSARILPDPTALFRPQLRLEGELNLAVPGLYVGRQWRPGTEVFVSFPRAAVHVIADEPFIDGQL